MKLLLYRIIAALRAFFTAPAFTLPDMSGPDAHPFRDKHAELSREFCANHEGRGFARPLAPCPRGWFWRRDRSGKLHRIYRLPICLRAERTFSRRRIRHPFQNV